MTATTHSPSPTRRLAIQLSLVTVGVCLALYLVVALALPQPLSARLLAAAVGIAGLLWLAAAVWIVRLRVGLPLRRLADEIRRLAATPTGERAAPLVVPELPIADALSEPVMALRELAEKSGREIQQAMRTGAGREEALRRRLEGIIRQLSQGVIVCDSAGRILLFNPAAANLLQAGQQLTLGSSIYDSLAQGPVDHALALLQRCADEHANAAQTSEVICPAMGQPVLLRCRFSPVPGADGTPNGGFVVAFGDVTRELEAERQREDMIRNMLDDLRGPLANLRAAAENLVSYDDMAAVDRHRFERLVADESSRLSGLLDRWAQESRLHSPQSVMVDISTTDVVSQVMQRLDPDIARITETGAPLWLRVDSHAVAVLLAHLIRCLAGHTAHREFDIEPLLGDRGVCLDIVWEGQPIAAGELDAWTQQQLTDAVGGPTAREVLERHRSELWSQRHAEAGFALLRMPLPVSPRQWRNPNEAIPARPEFYDFRLDTRTAAATQLGSRPLAELEYVAFDTETTGLDPEGGDELLAIGAVRLAGSRIQADQTFNELIKPSIPVPAESTRYHGITDRHVRYKPPVAAVLPRFGAFVGNQAVLVAHNAAFDMHFLAAAREATGTRFGNTVLDILLLSVYLEPDEAKQTPGAIAARLGLSTEARRNVLDDAMLAGRIFSSMIPALQDAGIHTLADALRAMEEAMSQRRERTGAPASRTGSAGGPG